jgi:hypothetical protein
MLGMSGHGAPRGSLTSTPCLLIWPCVALSACNAAPVELTFQSGDTEDLKYTDRARDAAAPELPAAPPASVPPGELPFSPGPRCENFPNVCDDEERSKCTLVSEDPGYRSSCVPDRGTLDIGASCERRVRGDDDCAIGGFCSPVGQGFARVNRLVCQRLCSSSSQCQDGEACLKLLSDETVGVCVPTCTVFADEQCARDELRCATAPEAGGAYFGYCEIFGNLVEDEACTLSSQCGRGLSCELESRRCRYSCDQAHPCPDERRCVPLEVGVPG